ncbi:MAG: hypothetical protein HQL52_05880 [Magnetococcales bacterium]|nr:hypothetical protein [Magnetococcales bacterium]
MNALPMDLLLWARGPGMTLALVILVGGLVVRLLETISMGHRGCLAPPVTNGSASSGVTTLWRRFGVPPGMLKRAPITYLGGYLFHVGLLITIFLFVPHIAFFKEVIGLSWPGLPNLWIDLATIAALAGMIMLLADRLIHPVKRFLSTFEDYLVWTLTFLPLLTGYLAFHHQGLAYETMLALHLLAVEALLVALPFTKLIHAITAFGARWYTGTWFGRKGIAS